MNTTYIATAGLESAPLQDGSVLYNLQTGKFILLNRSAAFLWTELVAPTGKDDLSRRLCATYPQAATPGLLRDVEAALSSFQDLQLVSSREGTAAAGTASPAATPQVESAAYEAPAIRVLDEDELLNIFQMTAAEISVASCWWSSCSPGCP